MPDVRYLQRPDFPSYQVDLDWALTSANLLDESEALASAFVIALGTDRLAAADDVLPGLDDTFRKGWWADTDAAEIWGAWPIGSRLWLLTRAKITDISAADGGTLTRVEAYVRECMRPFVDNKIASRITVNCQRTGTEKIEAHIVAYRGPSPAIELRYSDLWAELSGGR